VLRLRWYWGRINAWSEVSAMITAFIVSVLLQTVGGLDSDLPLDFARIVLVTVAVTTVVWLVVTFATRPETDATLVAFYRRTRPSRVGWGPVAARAPDVRPSADGLANLLDWIAGCVLVYGALFGVGKLLLHDPLPGILMLGLSAMAAKRDRSRALENSPACPETPPSRPAFSSCTSPRSIRWRKLVSFSVGAIRARQRSGGR